MIWSRGAHDEQIRSDTGHLIHKEAPDSFVAWGPKGSQDIDAIRAHTAKRLRELAGLERRPEDLRMSAGRGLIGVFTDPHEARAACEVHAMAGAA